MRLSRATKEVSVGAMVSLGLILFAVGVMAISKERRLFAKKVTYWTRFENTGGLAKGSPVRLVGVQIGSVDDIDFPEDPRETKIKVGFTVDQAYAKRIRAGTQAFLKSLTYLSQDKYIELTPGDPDKPELPADSFIDPGISMWEETIQQSQSIADDVKEITASLRDLLVAINRGGGIVQEMIHNPEFGRQGVTNLEGSLASMRRMLEGVEKGQGLAGAVLTDESFAKKQKENIDATLGHLRSLAEKVDSDQGMIGALTAPGGKGAETLDDLRAMASSLRRTSENIQNGKGLIGRLMNDERYGEDLLKKINSAVGHVDSIVRKVDRGEGTLGGIVNDPEVYQGLKDVVGGIKNSHIGKGLIRHYGKKGAKESGGGEEDQGGEKHGEEASPQGSPTPQTNP